MLTHDDNRPVVPFHGNHHPVEVYEGKESRNLIDFADTSGSMNRYYIERTTGFHMIAGTTYTLSVDVDASEEPFIFSVGYGEEIGTFRRDLKTVGGNTNGRVSITFVPTQENIDAYGDVLYFRLPRYSTSAERSYSVSHVQLELGDTAHPYEPYGTIASPLYLPAEATSSGTSLEFEGTYNDAAEVSVAGRSEQRGTPSPDSPVPIESMEAVTLESRGRNILDLSSATNDALTYVGGSTYRIAYAPSGRFSRPVQMSIPAGTKFTISGTLIEQMTVQAMRIQFGDKDGVAVGTRSFTGTTGTFYYDSDIADARIYVQATEETGAYVEFSHLMVELADTPHPYEPYHAASLDIDLQGNQLRSLPDGTRDWLVLTRSGKRWIDKGVGHRIASTASDINITSDYRVSVSVPGCSRTVAGKEFVCSMFLPGTLGQWGFTGEPHAVLGTNSQLYCYTAHQDPTITKDMFIGIEADYPLATRERIPLPDGEPLPTWWPYTRIYANGEDITAHVRIIED